MISIDEYLNTSYEPEAEFVEGVLVERNLGTPIHSLAQVIVGSHLHQYRKSHAHGVFMSVRVRLDAGRYRVADLAVLEKPYQKGKFVSDIPIVTVEITDPEDTFDYVMDKCFEYEALGVRNILVMDPDHRRAWLFEQNNLRLLTGNSVPLNLSHSTLDFPFAEMFNELDEG